MIRHHCCVSLSRDESPLRKGDGNNLLRFFSLLLSSAANKRRHKDSSLKKRKSRGPTDCHSLLSQGPRPPPSKIQRTVVDANRLNHAEISDDGLQMPLLSLERDLLLSCGLKLFLNTGQPWSKRDQVAQTVHRPTDRRDWIKRQKTTK